MITNFFKPKEKKSAAVGLENVVSQPSTEDDSSNAVDLEGHPVDSSPSGQKRKRDDIEKEEAELKNGKDEAEDEELSEEQLRAIEVKRQRAIEIRQTNLLLATEKENMAPDWFKVFESEMKKEYFTKIKQTLLKERENNAIVFPPENEIYTFTKCPLKNVRVVILGQDPYHGPGQAHGLCFSVKMGVKPPPSLVNIFKELQSDLGPDGFKIPDHGYLEGWCSQGVLLLNAALTVRKAEPNSHQKIGWATFTDAIVDHINKNMTNVVFMLWGGDAQKKGAKVDKKKHFVLKAVHPSPLSAHRGFLGCKHFSKANEYLKSRGRPLVDWNKL